jgi:hypothetical protein
MASTNTLLNPTIIAKETLLQLTNSMAMSKHVYTAYKNEFVKVGSTITIRKPNKFRASKTAVGSTATRSHTDLAEPSTSLAIQSQAHVSWSFKSSELTLTIADYSKRYIQPAALALANQIDVDLCGLYVDVAQSAGTPGTTPATFAALGDAQRMLDDAGAPSDTRVAIVNPKTNWALADGLKGTFAASVANSIITKGYLGTIANLSIYMDQNVVRHTTGIFSTEATPVLNADAVTGDATIVIKGQHADGVNTVTAGDVFTIAGVYDINPMSGASTGELKKFVILGAVSNSTSTITVEVYPAPVWASGPYQTVSTKPLTNMVVTFIGSEATAYPQNLVFHPNAFALVTVPLEMPSNVWGARETDTEAGLSCRVIKDYSITDDEEIIRLDVLYGVKTLYPELAVRLWG